jgi:hypothetical protein
LINGRRGREAIVDPEITRREVVSRIASGEYRNISFIHEIADQSVDDITEEILDEAAVPDIASSDSADLQAASFDHARDLKKLETAWRRPARDNVDRHSAFSSRPHGRAPVHDRHVFGLVDGRVARQQMDQQRAEEHCRCH